MVNYKSKKLKGKRYGKKQVNSKYELDRGIFLEKYNEPLDFSEYLAEIEENELSQISN
jgi:hypothetical protein